MKQQELKTDIINRKDWKSNSFNMPCYLKWGLIILGSMTFLSCIISFITPFISDNVKFSFYVGNLCLTIFLIIALITVIALLIKQHQEFARRDQELYNSLYKEEKTREIKRIDKYFENTVEALKDVKK